MIFVFEDNKDAPLSKLFQIPYSDINKFVYVSGNGFLFSEVSSLLNNTIEDILVFMDLVPGVSELNRLY